MVKGSKESTYDDSGIDFSNKELNRLLKWWINQKEKTKNGNDVTRVVGCRRILHVF